MTKEKTMSIAALDSEAQFIKELLVQGSKRLAECHIGKEKRSVTLLLLSQALERMLKLRLIYSRDPKINIKGLSHDLHRLLQKTEEISDDPSELQNARKDLHTNKLISIMDEFGRGKRYEDLDNLSKGIGGHNDELDQLLTEQLINDPKSHTPGNFQELDAMIRRGCKRLCQKLHALLQAVINNCAKEATNDDLKWYAKYLWENAIEPLR